MILRKIQTKVELAKYLHAYYLYSLITTFAKAVGNKNFSSWIGLMLQLILKHLLKSIYAYQEHIHSERQELQSTKKWIEAITKMEETLDHFPMSKVPNTRTNYIYYAIIDPEEVIIGYMDLTRYFPRRLSRSNEYIIVAYYFDTNHIRVLLIKNHRGATITEAQK